MLALGEPPVIMEYTPVRKATLPTVRRDRYDEDNPLHYNGLGTLIKSRRFGRGGF